MLNNKVVQHLVSETGLSINKLAKSIGVDHSTIIRLCNGESKDMKLSTAFKLADALGVDINEFRKEEENEI
ncbi:hypothetical protein CL176_02220 [Suicoccus acidiformans]|uniref:HTH cro/C1-type domain-containing protein n=1 Tax=Suicoccus acidiformans TaxID=2036206 RepID=A0A347WIM7_9LACT|nr:helix-turn-helix transcriptional regulator [Suicoccus acidiformans]AXY24934.1 hypothetical protein CL176_02220 [Suicoccus acidiformans]